MAVVKKSDAHLTWNSLRGKKSCHTAVGTSAGWNIPMGLIYNHTGSCKFGKCVLGGGVAAPPWAGAWVGEKFTSMYGKGWPKRAGQTLWVSFACP